jgi:protein-disulfide isomerase
MLMLSLALLVGCDPDPPWETELERKMGLRGPAPEPVTVLLDADQARVAAKLVGRAERFSVPVTASHAYRGPSDAPVTVVMFEDFQSPSTLFDTVALVRSTRENVRLVWRHKRTPHTTYFRAAALAQEALEQQGNEGFWKLYPMLHARPRQFDNAVLTQHAQTVGLDPARVQTVLTTTEHDATIEADDALARAIDAWAGFNVVLVNGRRVELPSFRGETDLLKVVDEELELAGDLLALGVPASELYATFIKDGRTELPDEERDVTFRMNGRVPDPKAVYNMPIEGAPSFGRSDAPVTVVAFVNLGCLLCDPGRFPKPAELLAKHGDDVRLVYMPRSRDTPTRRVLPSKRAARAMLEALDQGGNDAFWQLQDRYLEAGRDFSETTTLGWAKAIGLDEVKLKAAVESPNRDARIEAGTALGKQVGAHGLSLTYFINGRRISASERPEELDAVIAEEKAKAQKLLDAGVAPDRLYATLMATAESEPKFLP